MARTERAPCRFTPHEFARMRALVMPHAQSDPARVKELALHGLVLKEAAAVAAGAPPPPSMTVEVLATLAAQAVQAVLPLLARTGRLDLLMVARMSEPVTAPTTDVIDAGVADDLDHLGSTFL